MPIQPGVRIRAFRKQFDLTQENLADLLGVSFRTTRAWESGRWIPKPYLWLALETLERKLECQSRSA